MGCSDDENLSPSDVPEYEITLPQGEHEYDDRIVNWFDRINSIRQMPILM